MKKEEFVIVDIETTGLSKHRHKITEIAAVKMKNGKIIDEFQSLVNPKVPIPRFITKLTGIDDALVKDAPPISKIIPHFIDFLGEATLVAHNATFDHGFLHENAKHCLGKGIDNQTLCTRKLANRILNHLPSKKLSRLCEHFEIVNERAHRAMADVDVTAKIFRNFLNTTSEKGFTTLEELKNLETSSPSKVSMIFRE